MSTDRPTPGPRVPLALRLAARLLPADIREEVLGDLLEHWSRHGRHRPWLARWAWAWRQPLRVLGDRLRFGARSSLRDRLPRGARGRQGGAAGAGVRRRRRRPVSAARRSALGVSWLDVKLGLRMLLKYPGLTIVAGLTLAVGIPIGMYPLHLMSVTEAPLPFEASDRVLVLRYVEETSFARQRVPFQDFVRWRDALTSFETLGATTLGLSYNVISEDGRAAPVRGAEVTASVFDILRARPLLGRTLVPEDEVPGAADVVVISQDLWESRLGRDPDVVGKSIRIGGTPHTVVGVMPEGFLFPVRDHIWLPLRVDELARSELERAQSEPDAEAAGPPRVFFGRLAGGVSRQQAEAEASALGPRATLERREANRPLRAEVVSLPMGLMNSEASLSTDPEFYYLQGILLLVLVVACANVGMLIFARTATRTSELAVRTALGASRARVVSQLFVESFVLAVLAAGAGLAVGQWVLVPYAEGVLPPSFPYWLDFGVTRATVFRALALAVISATVAGVLPALKATGKGVQRSIQRAAAGRSGIRFGGGSSALIAADVALAVVTVAFALAYSSGFRGFESDGTTRSHEFLSAELTVPRAVGTRTLASDAVADQRRVARTQQELVRRLAAETGVLGVAMADVLPGMDHPMRWIEVEGVPGEDARGHRAATASVAPGFFEAFEHPLTAGRAFDLADLDEGATAVIVNTDFVDQVLGGRNPIGRRVRYRAPADEEPAPWQEIVGVVGRLGTVALNSEPISYQALYQPLAAGQSSTVRVAVHLAGDAESFTARLRALAGQVDPAAIVSDTRPLDEVVSYTRLGHATIMAGSATLLFVLVALAASGIYALMSFTITERTREIGIRTALGADKGRIVSAVGKRAVAQLGAGVLLGMPLAALLLAEWQTEGAGPGSSPYVLTMIFTLVVGALAMLVIGLLACTAPTLRALRIAPTVALREGG